MTLEICSAGEKALQKLAKDFGFKYCFLNDLDEPTAICFDNELEEYDDEYEPDEDHSTLLSNYLYLKDESSFKNLLNFLEGFNGTYSYTYIKDNIKAYCSHNFYLLVIDNKIMCSKNVKNIGSINDFDSYIKDLDTEACNSHIWTDANYFYFALIS